MTVLDKSPTNELTLVLQTLLLVFKSLIGTTLHYKGGCFRVSIVVSPCLREDATHTLSQPGAGSGGTSNSGGGRYDEDHLGK